MFKQPIQSTMSNPEEFDVEMAIQLLNHLLKDVKSGKHTISTFRTSLNQIGQAADLRPYEDRTNFGNRREDHV